MNGVFLYSMIFATGKQDILILLSFYFKYSLALSSFLSTVCTVNQKSKYKDTLSSFIIIIKHTDINNCQKLCLQFLLIRVIDNHYQSFLLCTCISLNVHNFLLLQYLC